jgi:hypothetical protein
VEPIEIGKKLLAYCAGQEWAGYDPYDALNSKFVESSPLLQKRIPSLVLTQLLKRSPINLRGPLLIPKRQNPKALALFISSLARNPELAGDRAEGMIDSVLEQLVALRSAGTTYWCWGYSFPWRGRNMIVKRFEPNLVCTDFAATAILDLYEVRRQPELLKMAVSSAEFILNELYWTGEGDVAGFAYPLASIRNQVHNANLLGSALLCRIYALTGDQKFVEPALKAARYSASMQREDGSWPYGEAKTQAWVDNFHTGYNLCALRAMRHSLKTDEFDQHLAKGLAFYRDHFFRTDGAPRYFHNGTYPIDIHCVAQSILTLVEFADWDEEYMRLARRVYEWAVEHMWDERGFFYYRVLRFGRIRTPYMRWSEAWMVRALAELARALQGGEKGARGIERMVPVC